MASDLRVRSRRAGTKPGGPLPGRRRAVRIHRRRVEQLAQRITWSDDSDGRTLLELRQRWKELSEKSKKPEDSSERRLARRVLGTLSATVASTDPDYLKIISEYRTGRGRR